MLNSISISRYLKVHNATSWKFQLEADLQFYESILALTREAAFTEEIIYYSDETGRKTELEYFKNWNEYDLYL